MNDNTVLFKSIVEKILLDSIGGYSGIPQRVSQRKSSPNFLLFSKQAREVLQNITELKQLIMNKRAQYILSNNSFSFFGHSTVILGSSRCMSNSERKRFDMVSDTAIKQCSRLVQYLETNIASDQNLRTDDEYMHLKLAVNMLNVYLKCVCRIAIEMREISRKLQQRYRQFSRLRNLVDMSEHLLLDHSDAQLRLCNGNVGANKETVLSTMSKDMCQQKMCPEQPPDLVLQSFEQERLELENARVFQRLSNASPDFSNIEIHLGEIQRLQDLFTERIMEQDQEIDVVHVRTVHTLDTLDDANEFIRAAMRNGASRRIISLFCLIVLSFTLLFLDWYKP